MKNRTRGNEQNAKVASGHIGADGKQGYVYKYDPTLNMQMSSIAPAQFAYLVAQGYTPEFINNYIANMIKEDNSDIEGYNVLPEVTVTAKAPAKRDEKYNIDTNLKSNENEKTGLKNISNNSNKKSDNNDNQKIAINK